MPDADFPPPLSCDCHAHVIGPKAVYPLVSPRAYTPADAPVSALAAMLDRVGLARVVVVQTSIFGSDNRCMLDALAALGDRARGVAVPPEVVEPRVIDEMNEAGVRGVRINLATLGLGNPDEARRRLRTAVGQCERNGWHVQLFASAETTAALAADIAALPVPLIIDHFGLLSPGEAGTPVERAILSLLGSGKLWIKLSASYRLSPPDIGPRMAALAQRLFAANPERVVWGSDWPHTPKHPGGLTDDEEELPYRDVDDRALLGTIRAWFEDPRDRQAILVDNPARLYGF